MPIKRGNIDVDVLDEQREEETDEQRESREAREEQDRRDSERDQKLREAEIARAKAEGEAEALRRGVGSAAPPAAAALTEDQWQNLEQQTGKTRHQIMADAQLSRATAEEAIKPLREMLQKSQEEIREAKEEARRAKAGTSLYATEKDFYDKNPGLVGHRGVIDSFLAKFPEEVRSDPAKLKDLLEDAKVYVRGKVREDRSQGRGRDDRRVERRDSTERPRFDDEDESRRDEPDLDLADLDNEGSKRLIESIARNPGGDDINDRTPSIDEVDLDEAYRISERPDKRGVAINERAEFARGQRRADRSLRDPSRGLRTSEEERDRRRDYARR